MDPRTSIRPLNRVQAETIYHLFHHDPMVGACAQVILRTIFSGGIHIESGTNDAFLNHLEEYWLLFPTQCVQSFMMFGIVPYTIKSVRIKPHGRKLKYPFVLPYGTYTLFQRSTTDYS